MKRRNFISLSSVVLGSSFLKLDSASAAVPKELTNHVILITGGTSGIGENSARELAKVGAKVVFCGRREALGTKIQNEIRDQNGSATYLKCDVREESQVNKLISDTIKLHGKIDSIFINAGIAQTPTEFHKTSTESFRNLFETNCFGSFFCARAVLPQFMKQRNGVIIFNSSFGAKKVISGEVAYSASKIAIDTFVKHLATDYARYNIKSFSLEPLSVKTPMLENRARFLKKNLDAIGNPLLGRVIQPEEISNLVKMLLTANSQILSGTVFDLSAGAGQTYLVTRD